MLARFFRCGDVRQKFIYLGIDVLDDTGYRECIIRLLHRVLSDIAELVSLSLGGDGASVGAGRTDAYGLHERL